MGAHSQWPAFLGNVWRKPLIDGPDMTEKIAPGHIERDPRPHRDLAAAYLGARGVNAGVSFSLTDIDAQEAAYAGYPDIIADIQEGSQTQVVDHADKVVTPLHLHTDGRPKKIYEAKTDAERRAIIAKTNTVVVTGVGRSALSN